MDELEEGEEQAASMRPHEATGLSGQPLFCGLSSFWSFLCPFGLMGSDFEVGDRWAPGRTTGLLMTLWDKTPAGALGPDWVEDKETISSFLWSRGFPIPAHAQRRSSVSGRGQRREAMSACNMSCQPLRYLGSGIWLGWAMHAPTRKGPESGQIWAQARWLAKDNP